MHYNDCTCVLVSNTSRPRTILLSLLLLFYCPAKHKPEARFPVFSLCLFNVIFYVRAPIILLFPHFAYSFPRVSSCETMGKLGKQLSWDEIKGRQDKEYYLGQSVKAATGREAENQFWYERSGGLSGPAPVDEIQRVKEQEERMMEEALGVKPRSKPSRADSQQSRLPMELESHEVQGLLRRGRENAGEDEDDPQEQALSVRGIGYAQGGGLPRSGASKREVVEGVNVPSSSSTAPREGSKGALEEGRAEGKMERREKRERETLKGRDERRKKKSRKSRRGKERDRKERSRSRSRASRGKG